ncbi:MAG: SseB family protein [Bariatricus sp.]|nr:SseB family protein [Bariatricus sp.]
MDNKQTQQKVLQMIRSMKEIYVIFSDCTKLPYVICDPETYDDEILVYFDVEECKNKVRQLMEDKIPVKIVKIENKSFLEFYVSLYPMGVNEIVYNHGMKDEIRIQLEEMVTRKSDEKMPSGKERIENPELHLTAIYYMQTARRLPPEQVQKSEELRDLNEEMMAHFKKGRYLVISKEGKEMVVLKQKDGKVFQPIFTDVQELGKFLSVNRTQKFMTGIVDADKVIDILVPESEGVAINPFGINLQLKMKRK